MIPEQGYEYPKIFPITTIWPYTNRAIGMVTLPWSVKCTRNTHSGNINLPAPHIPWDLEGGFLLQWVRKARPHNCRHHFSLWMFLWIYTQDQDSQKFPLNCKPGHQVLLPLKAQNRLPGCTREIEHQVYIRIKYKATLPLPPSQASSI